MHALVEDMPSKVEAALSYGQSLKNPGRKEYQNIIKDIKRVFVTNYQKNVDVHFFGSRLMGLATHDSDLDTYIDLGKHYFEEKLAKSAEWLTLSKEAFRKDIRFKIIEELSSATSPILIVQHVESKRYMDISFSNGFGVENTLFIKHLFEIKAEAKKLFYHIRIWFKENNLELKSYLLKVLVIFYLQTQGFMPSVKKIQDRLPPRNIGGINVAYDKNSKRNTDGCHSFLSYKPHIRPFFIFYANYDFRQYIICPYLGKSVAKVGCTNELMEHIITRIANTKKKWDISAPMIVLTPFKASKNLTQNFTQELILNFQELCCESARYHHLI